MSRLTLAVLVWVASTACDVARPSELTQSRWIRYHHWPDEAPCDEALQQLDGLVDFVSARFGLSPRTVDYFKWRAREAEAVRARCGGQFAACAGGTDALTTGWAHDHEVVHTQLEAVGLPPPLFVEGVAVVYGCGQSSYRGEEVDRAVELERLVSLDEWEAEYATNGHANYAAAGSFVRRLLDTWGEAAFLRFYGRAPRAGGAEARRAFHEVFGVTFDEAVASWRSAGPERLGSFCMLAVDPCVGPAHVGQGLGPTTRSLSCVGAVASIASGVDEAVAFGVTSSERPVTGLLESCDPGSSVETEALLPPDAPVFPDHARFSTVGRQLEVRAFGLGPRALLRMHASHADDGWAVALDPEAAPLDGPSGGEVTLRALAEPERLWTPGCDGGATTVEAGSWGLHLAGPVSSIPPDGGVLRLHSEAPVGIPAWSAVGLLSGPAFCPDACGPSGDAGCSVDSGAAATDHHLRVAPVEDAGWTRFSLGLRFAP